MPKAKRNLLGFILLFGSVFGNIFHVPGTYPTIQNAIDSTTSEDDTVLVAPGTYLENLSINKSITLASQAIFSDSFDDWVIDCDGSDDSCENNWCLNTNSTKGDFISQTIIDGSAADDEAIFKSTIFIDSPAGECVKCVILGFTIKNGKGTRIVEYVEVPFSDDLATVKRNTGGGIFSNNAAPIINYNFITENQDEKIYHGAGLTIGEDIGIDEALRTPRANVCDNIDIDISKNLFSSNMSENLGRTFYTNYNDLEINMDSSYFDVFDPSDQSMPYVWINTVDSEGTNIDFSQGNGNSCGITNNIIIDADTGEDVGTDGPFQTIAYALGVIHPTDEAPITIFIEEGIYSYENTGEVFPIILPPNVSLIGASENETILDASYPDEWGDGYWSVSQALFITSFFSNNDYSNTLIKNLTIQGGKVDFSPTAWEGAACGAGVSIFGASPTFENVTISDNYMYGSPEMMIGGAGMCIWDYGETELYNITIENNHLSDTDIGGGAGLFIGEGASAYIENITITDNTVTANYFAGGGGLLCWDANSLIYGATIARNSAIAASFLGYSGAGGILVNISDPIFVNTTVTQNSVYNSYFGTETFTAAGGIHSEGYSNPVFINSIIYNNGLDIYLGWTEDNYDIVAFFSQQYGLPNLASPGNIMIDYSNIGLLDANNTDDLNYYEDLSIAISDNSTVDYRDHNINVDPNFTNCGESDYCLDSASDCIDAGTADYYYGGEVIIDTPESEYYGSAPDMGAIEYYLIGDVTGDDEINVLDVVALVNAILNGENIIGGDVNEDGVVNVLDIVMLVDIILNPK